MLKISKYLASSQTVTLDDVHQFLKKKYKNDGFKVKGDGETNSFIQYKNYDKKSKIWIYATMKFFEDRDSNILSEQSGSIVLSESGDGSGKELSNWKNKRKFKNLEEKSIGHVDKRKIEKYISEEMKDWIDTYKEFIKKHS